MTDGFPTDTSHFKLIVSDFDGTLAGANHIISSNVKEAIRRWMDSGHFFTIASGRQYMMIAEDVKELGLTTPLIVRGGAEIVDFQGKIIFSESIDRDVIKEFVEIMVTNDYGVIVEIDDTLYGNFDYGVTEYPHIFEKSLKELPYTDAPKMVVRVSAERVEETENFMNNHVIPKFPTLHLVRSYNVLGMAYDITSLKATKNLAVLELIRHLGLEREDTVGVGDGYNDFPLLEACGLKVAMENANEDLKKIADIIVPSYEQDGVAYLIDKLLK